MDYAKNTLILGLLSLLVMFNLGSCVTYNSVENISSEYYNIGNGFFELGNYSKAIYYYEKAYKLNPKLSNSRYNLALSYSRVGRFDDAKKVLNDLLVQDPKNLKILKALAYNYYLKGDEDKTVEFLNRILEEYPEDRDALNNLGVIYWKRGEIDNAITEFKKLLEYYPGDEDTKFNLGKVLIENEKFDEGLKYIEDYAELKPDDYEAFVVMGYAYEGLRDYKRALDSFSYALSLNDKLKGVWFESAFILLTKVEDPERGKTSLERAIELGFNDKKKLNSLLASEELIDKEGVIEILKDKNIKLGSIGLDSK